MIVRGILVPWVLAVMLSPVVAFAQTNNVDIDGLFADWQDETTTFDSSDGATNECNDHPNQGDITGAGIASNFDTVQPATTIYLRFDFDDVGVSGAGQSMDGCWLLDANANGRVEQALCFTLKGNPALITDRRYFTCNDTTIDTCAGPTAVALPASAACSVGSVTGANIINDCTTDEPLDIVDRGVECEIALADFPIGVVGNTVSLLEACSYNSQQPNSNGVDCVIDPNNPWSIDITGGTNNVSALPVELQSFIVN